MADHFSGPRALADPASDITDVYAFASPERPGHMVLVLDVFPAAPATALFSDAITHRFRLRPVTATNAGGAPAFVAGAEEWRFDVRFDAPPPRDGGATVQGTCTRPGGAAIPLRVGDERPTEAPGLRIFAGPRLDPFFIDLNAVLATEEQEQLAFRSASTNSLAGANVLSIVVEFDVATVLGPDSGPLLAVVGETLTSGHEIRLERMGRAEIKNVIMRPKKFDPVNRDLEIRDLYNAEDAFALRPDYVGAYRARLNANLAFFDRLDGSIDWPPDEQGNHPLTELLLADFLVVDTSRPFAEGGDSDLEIERAVLAGRPHTTCGGRSPWRDIIDTLYSLLVGGLHGARIGDGVRQARPPSRTFPYLCSPNPEPPGLATLFPALAAPPGQTAPARPEGDPGRDPGDRSFPVERGRDLRSRRRSDPCPGPRGPTPP